MKLTQFSKESFSVKTPPCWKESHLLIYFTCFFIRILTSTSANYCFEKVTLCDNQICGDITCWKTIFFSNRLRNCWLDIDRVGFRFYHLRHNNEPKYWLIVTNFLKTEKDFVFKFSNFDVWVSTSYPVRVILNMSMVFFDISRNLPLNFLKKTQPRRRNHFVNLRSCCRISRFDYLIIL